MSGPGEFAGQVVIVTGAAGGIGAVTAARFAAVGAAVVLVDRDEQGLQTVAASIDADAAPTVVAGDLRDDATSVRVVDDTLERFGRLDVLVNNAGYFPGAEKRLHEGRADGGGLERKQWDLALDINLRASAAMCTAALAPMVAAGSGAIVNTSSAQGRAGDVAWASYGIAKAGVESLTRYVATQYGRDGIRCNAVAPGLTATANALARLPEANAAAIAAQTPLGRLARADEIAEVVVFLASPRASFVTGQVLAVDGGLLCHLPPADPP